MSALQPIETAPRDGTTFLALNQDGEFHVAMIDEHGRFCRRTHQQRWSQSFSIEDGRQILTSEHFHFDTHWSLWTKGYEFEPTHWSPLPKRSA
jgi:hypothetical protein